jgi:hypothetical protein
VAFSESWDIVLNLFEATGTRTGSSCMNEILTLFINHLHINLILMQYLIIKFMFSYVSSPQLFRRIMLRIGLNNDLSGDYHIGMII